MNQMNEVQREFFKLQAATVLCILVIVGIIVYVVVDGHSKLHKIEEGRYEARLALCQELNTIKTVQRNDLQQKIGKAEIFLKKNPTGIPGIPASLILDGIADDKAFKAKLADADCVDFALHPTVGLKP